MEEKKQKKQEGKSAPPGLNYEDILNDFAKEEGTDTKSAESSRMDLDGRALAELLGEEVADTPAGGMDSGHFDAIGVSDYSELARQFEEFDLAELAGNDGESDAEEDTAPPEIEITPAELSDVSADMKLDDEELPLDDSAGYAALLDQLEAEGKPEPARSAASEKTAFTAIPAEDQAEPDSVAWELRLEEEPEKPEHPEESSDAPVRTEVLSIVNLAESMDAPQTEPVIEESPALLPEESSAPEPGGLDLSDLFAEEAKTTGVEAAEAAVLPKNEPEAAPPVETAQTGMDFLGLTAIAPQENHVAGKPPRRMEVLFEGVEMNFEDQTDEVTLAELLLAQGKKKEAADLFQRVSRNKGTTFWVAKRLRSLAASAEKQ